MNSLYYQESISRQYFYQRYQREIDHEAAMEALVQVVKDIREDHPNMGVRQIYIKLSYPPIGRDRFESWAFQHSFRLRSPKRYLATTEGSETGCLNLLIGISIDNVNQVWVCDISYYWLNGSFYYLALIMDLYSRRVLSCVVSKSLTTESTNLQALKEAVKERGIKQYGHKLILHSDRGGQYKSKRYIAYSEVIEARISMGKIVWDNSHAERVIQTIKKDYIMGYSPRTYSELKVACRRAIRMYNFEKPHSAHKGLTPAAFEQWINNVEEDKRPRMQVFSSELTKSFGYQQKEKRSKKEKDH
jgi:transposase InsO family protein